MTTIGFDVPNAFLARNGTAIPTKEIGPANAVTHADRILESKIKITKRFGKIVANDGINLKVKRGEILSLLGENGSGKTTLNQIKEPNDIKRISPKLYPVLAEEIRDFLLNNVSQTGGHLASNLGAVEITMALHICLRFPEDKVVYDVGHQSYVHKILTGRKDEFSTLRQKDGLCGFPKRSESECDVFGTGHSSTSISAALGLAVARDLEQKDNTVVAVIGDGALSGGMAYEALNNLSILRKEKKNMIIILNDNKMSISENVGGMSRYLNDLRSRKR